MIDRFRQFLTADCFSLSRRDFLTTSAVVAGGLAMTPVIGADGAAAAPLKEVRFSEAVHNLGYINLYVGMHAGIFEKNGLDMKVNAAGGDTQTFAAVLGGSADFAIGDATMAQISRENGGPGVVVGTVVQRAHYFGVSKTLKPITDPGLQRG
jgi:NitT/TauT family transport system substrate-binding protein